MATFIGTDVDDFQHNGWSTLYGNGGNDHLASDQAGADFAYGGPGDDILFVSNAASIAYIDGGEGNDAVFGHLLDDEVLGGEGDDLVAGGDFYWPELEGDPVTQYDPATGDDRLSGGDGRDGVYGFDGDDVILGGKGDDSSAFVVVLPGFDTWTDHGALVVRAGLFGGSGDDEIDGGKGSDHLFGEWGADTLVGGRAADIFVFAFAAESSRADGRDLIKDFSHAEHDRIDLYWMDANANRKGDQAFDFIGNDAFSGKAAEFRFAKHWLSGDIDGDGKADFQIKVAGVNSLGESDFYL